MNKKREIKVNVEAPDETKVVAFIAPRRYLNSSFVTLFQDVTIALASNKNLTTTDLRVLLGLLGFLDYENEINISQSKLGKAIGIDQRDISKSIKKLIEENCITITRTEGRRNIYTLNPYLGLKGRGSKHKKLCQEWDENPQDC